MMSEAGEPENGTESSFEFVNTTTSNLVADAFALPPSTAAPTGSIAPPASLPAFATLPKPEGFPAGSLPSAPPIVQGSLHTGPPPPPSAFPQVAAVSKGDNPFSIRASATSVPASQQASPPQPPFATPPVPPQSMAHPPPMAPIQPAAGVGLDMPFTSHDDPFVQQDTKSGGGMWGWIQGTVNQSQILTKVAEKAKTSVDSMITTLDPQMKNYLHPEAALEVAVASDKEVKISAIRDSFQNVFGQSFSRGLGSPGLQTRAAQPSGFENGKKYAQARISRLRHSGLVSPQIPVVAVENFVFTVDNQAFDAAWIQLDDEARGISLSVISQATPIPNNALIYLKNHTPPGYEYSSEGYAVTVGQAVAETIGVPPTEWHLHVTSISRKVFIVQAATSLANMYKQQISSNYLNPNTASSINIG